MNGEVGTCGKRGSEEGRKRKWGERQEGGCNMERNIFSVTAIL